MGVFRGFTVTLSGDPTGLHKVFNLRGSAVYTVEISESAQGQAQRFDNAVNGIEKKLYDAEQALLTLASDRADLEEEIRKPNPYDAEIRKTAAELRSVSRKLGL